MDLFILLFRQPIFIPPSQSFVSIITFVYLPWPRIPQSHVILIIEDTYLYSDPPHSIGFLGTSDQSDADITT
jgi:hypothetical protein